MLTKTQETAIREYYTLADNVRDMIRGATWDLFNGPLSVDDADDQGIKRWRGFTHACRVIRDALDVGDLWIGEDGLISESEPDWTEECPDVWCQVDSSLVRRVLVGRELAGYL